LGAIFTLPAEIVGQQSDAPHTTLGDGAQGIAEVSPVAAA
jgi:hypothetical protein